MVIKHNISNGMRLVAVPMKGVGAFTALVLVRTGSKYETKRTNGTAHYVEHMIFKGCRGYPSVRAITEALDGLGAEYNAFTSKEMTGYWIKVGRDNSEKALRIVADMLASPLFPKQEFERERGVILQEINMYFDTPGRFIFDVWEEALWGDQPAGWHVAGNPKTINGLTYEDLHDYFKAHYGAQDALVMLAGSFDRGLVPKAVTMFKSIPRGAPTQHPKIVEAQMRPNVKTVFKKTDQTHIALGFRGVDMQHPQRYAIAVLATILGGTMSSRIFLKVRDRLGLAYSIRTQAAFDTESGYLVTSGGVKNENVPQAISAILKEYQIIRRTLPKAAEIKKAKDSMIGHFMLDLEQTDEVASYYATQELLLGEITVPEEEVRHIKKVTAADVVKVARMLFRPDRLNLALIGPFRDKAPFIKLLKSFKV